MDINKIFGHLILIKDENGFPMPKFIKDMEENHPRYYIGMFSKLLIIILIISKGFNPNFKAADPKL
jgi:hypothetical protein